MIEFPNNLVRTFLLEYFKEPLELREYTLEEIPDDFDLLTNGIIDSVGFLEMTLALQEEFHVEIDFEEIDPEELSIIGPLCRYVSKKKQQTSG